jgi:hypothetical protein
MHSPVSIDQLSKKGFAVLNKAETPRLARRQVR